MTLNRNRFGIIARFDVVTSALVFLTAVLLPVQAEAQFLSERLVPPQQVPAPAVPLVTAPAQPKVFGADRNRSHMWSLPFGSFPGAPTLLDTEKRPLNWFRPTLDLPGLAADLDPARPTYPIQPVAPRVYLASAEPQSFPRLARFPQQVEPVVLATEDPSFMAAFGILTAPVPLAGPGSVPLLPLSITDPFEHLHRIRPSVALPDSDDPVVAQDRPPLAKLPMVEISK